MVLKEMMLRQHFSTCTSRRQQCATDSHKRSMMVSYVELYEDHLASSDRSFLDQNGDECRRKILVKPMMQIGTVRKAEAQLDSL